MAATLTLPDAIARAFSAYESGHLEDAEALCQAILQAKPDAFDALHLSGVLHSVRGQHAEAFALYERALAIRPDVAGAWNNRGNSLKELKRFDEALASYDKALALAPADVSTLNNRGVALQNMQAFDLALASFDRALALKPDFADALNNRGNALQRLTRFDEALDCYDRVLALKPSHAEALYNRGNTLRLLKRFPEAIASYDRALAVKPDHADAFSQMAHCVNWICDWRRKSAIAGEVIARVAEGRALISPFTFLGYCDDPALQLQCARSFDATAFPSVPSPLIIPGSRRHDKLRIGYLSADFHEHATAYQLAGLFEQHDHSRFEVIGVSLGADDKSPMRKRLVAAFNRFHDVAAQSDTVAAGLLHREEVDILVTLNAFTQNARLGMLASRPAPVQVSYPGFPGTTGAPFIDYIIADETVAPFEQGPFYSEQIVQLPNCYLASDATRPIAATPTRREAGLPDAGFVFCCFNNSWKIAPDVFDVWMRLLREVAGSVLWLLRDNAPAEQNLCREAQARGVDPARLVFAERKSAAEHLARHRLADLFLDTLPVNAHATASDALWSGLPLVTQLGGAFAGRVAASHLQALALPELITKGLAEYEALALRLANEPQLLKGYRERLASNRLTRPLFDTKRSCRHLEAAYRRMWETWQRGDKPHAFAVGEQR